MTKTTKKKKHLYKKLRWILFHYIHWSMSIVESDNPGAGVEAVATGEGLAREEQTRESVVTGTADGLEGFCKLWGTLGSSSIWCFKWSMFILGNVTRSDTRSDIFKVSTLAFQASDFK